MLRALFSDDSIYEEERVRGLPWPSKTDNKQILLVYGERLIKDGANLKKICTFSAHRITSFIFFRKKLHYILLILRVIEAKTTAVYFFI